MRWGFLACAIFVLSAPATAWAQTSVTLDARNGAPLVDAQINGRPVQFEVDTRLPDGLALSRAAAQRLRVRQVPFLGIAIAADGGDSRVSGRIARPRIVFDGEDSRAFAGVFPVPVTTRGDGAIGPGAMPHDLITITLGAEQPGARDITFPLENGDVWLGRADVGGRPVRVEFDVINSATVFNRPASRMFDASGGIVAEGEVVDTPMLLGLRTMMQPIRTDLTVGGLALTTARARTNSPLLGADEEGAVVVSGEDNGIEPRITIGRGALIAARCSSISVDRRAKRMTLRCAP
jgi:hypothetical protein